MKRINSVSDRATPVGVGFDSVDPTLLGLALPRCSGPGRPADVEDLAIVPDLDSVARTMGHGTGVYPTAPRILIASPATLPSHPPNSVVGPIPGARPGSSTMAAEDTA